MTQPSADGWLYVSSRSVRSMGATQSWTRHFFRNGESECGYRTLGRLQHGYAAPGQGKSKTCRLCSSVIDGNPLPDVAPGHESSSDSESKR